MAVDAGAIPSIERACPMKCRARCCRSAFTEPKPFLLLRVPGDIERLQPAATKIDQILLQRVTGECIFHLEVRRFAVCPFGADEESTVPPEEGCLDAVAFETSVVKICANRLVIGKPLPSRDGILRRRLPDRCDTMSRFSRPRIRHEASSADLPLLTLAFLRPPQTRPPSATSRGKGLDDEPPFVQRVNATRRSASTESTERWHLAGTRDDRRPAEDWLTYASFSSNLPSPKLPLRRRSATCTKVRELYCPRKICFQSAFMSTTVHSFTAAASSALSRRPKSLARS